MNPIKTLFSLICGSISVAIAICMGTKSTNFQKKILDVNSKLKDNYPFNLDLVQTLQTDPIWNLIAYRYKNSLQEIFNIESFDRSKQNWRDGSSVFGKGIFYFCKSIPEKQIKELMMNLNWGENINGKIERLIAASKKWCVDPGSPRNIGEKLIFEGKNIRYEDADAYNLYKNDKDKLKEIFNFKNEIQTKEDMIGAGKVIIQWCKSKFKEDWTSGENKSEAKLKQTLDACVLKNKFPDSPDEAYEQKIKI